MEQIKNTADKVKVTKSAEEAEGSASERPSAGPSNPGSSLSESVTNQTKVSGDEYISPLQHLRSENDQTKVFDPDTLLCRFELGGKCMDVTCRYQHCRPGK